jgi:hypothetical protein
MRLRRCHHDHAICQAAGSLLEGSQPSGINAVIIREQKHRVSF